MRNVKFEPNPVRLNAVYYASAGNLKQIDLIKYDLSNVNLKIISNEVQYVWIIKHKIKLLDNQI